MLFVKMRDLWGKVLCLLCDESPRSRLVPPFELNETVAVHLALLVNVLRAACSDFLIP